jgi:hypothetical protein
MRGAERAGGGPRPAGRTAAFALAGLLAVASACGDHSGGDAQVIDSGGTDLGGGGGPTQAAASVEAFSRTAFPLLRQHCADCHAGSGPGTPAIAHLDPATAHAAVVDHQKVNLSNPTSSRIVRRLVSDFHYCWADCVTDGAQLLAAVEAWAAAVAASGGGGGGGGTVVDAIASEGARLADGVEDVGQARVSDGLIGLWEFKELAGTVARDTSGVAPALDLELTGDAALMSSYGIDFAGGRATGTRAASRKLFDRIAETAGGTQQYAVEAWVAPANVTQEGPARIVSYSNGSGSSNFALGQVLYTYVFRNRSVNPEVSGNGTPALQTYDGDQDLQATLQHVVVTYDQYRGRRIHVDGRFTDDVDEVEATRLWNWSAEHALVLGNTTSDDRPWLGQIRLLAIYEYVLSEAQILQNFAASVGKRVLLRLDVSRWAGPGAYLEFVASELDDASYLFCQPTLVAPAASGLRVAGLRVAVNGVAPVSGQGFVNVDTLVTQTHQQLSRGCSVISKDQGPAADVFTIEFEYLGTFEDPFVPPPPPPLPVPTFDGEPPPVEGVRSFERLRETMASLTGVDPNDAEPLATYEELRQQLPGTFDLRAFSASQQVAISKLALEFCDVMVESPALRDAFFGPFPFDAPAATAFGSAASRDQVIDALVDRMLGVAVASQPTRDEVRPILDGLTSALVAGCDAASCGPDRTRNVTKALCAAVLASAAVSVH